MAVKREKVEQFWIDYLQIPEENRDRFVEMVSCFSFNSLSEPVIKIEKSRGTKRGTMVRRYGINTYSLDNLLYRKFNPRQFNNNKKVHIEGE